MKSKLLPIILLLLILLNGILIFTLLNRPNNNKEIHPDRNFLTEQLQFSNSQNAKFSKLEMDHRSFMNDIVHSIRTQKDVLFNSFDSSLNTDSILNLIGILEIKKEKEVFRFFSKVREICSEDQIYKFDKIIKEALKGVEKGRPPRDGRMPPPRGDKHHPPR